MLGELSKEEIEEVLKSNVIGRIGCTGNGRIYVVPITYVYDDGYVIGHTKEGMKIEFLRENPECCFEVDEMKGISHWQSVIAWGTFEEWKNWLPNCCPWYLAKQVMLLEWGQLPPDAPQRKGITPLYTAFC